MTEQVKINIIEHPLDDKDAFYLIYVSFRKELERQKEFEKDYPKDAFNINSIVLQNFLEQLREQEPEYYSDCKKFYEFEFSKNQ